ncbi:hypothetical protein J7M07_07370, partial [bacterium]|nr:hypothetical protein [bacterium]
YKFIHNIFLGQLPKKYENLKKAPFTMKLPIVILSSIIVLFGILPGIPLKVINSIDTGFGLKALDISIWGVNSNTGTLNIINIFAAVLAIFIIVWLIFKAGRKSIPVSQDDNYAAGTIVPEGKYNYTVDFYNPLTKMISPYFKDVIDVFYVKLARGVQNLCGVVRRIYTGEVGFYVMYIILFLAAVIFAQIKWSIW